MKQLFLALILLITCTLSAHAACTQALTTAGKQAYLTGTHDSGDTYKLAFYTNTATYGAATTAYSATNEVSGTGYTAGGYAVVPTPGASGTTGIIDFADIAPTVVTFSAASTCAVLYNVTDANAAIAVFTFTSVQPTAGTLTVDFPASGASTSTIRFALLDWLIPSAYADDAQVAIGYHRDARVNLVGVEALGSVK